VPYAVKDEDGSKRVVTRTLAEGLGLADGPADDRWVVIREQRSSLEYLRSVADLRERGLHVRLHAYETRVFWELRELHDGAGIWRRLAERLGERGVPSLEDELRNQQLGPVHDALRAVIAEPSRGPVERLVAAIAEATGTDGDRVRVVDLVAERAAGAMPTIEGIEDPSQQATMRLWTLLAPIGALPEGAPVGPTSRAWYEELRLAPVVVEGLRARGLDEGAAWWAAERARTLLDLPLPSAVGGPADSLPLRLVDAWLAHPAVRPFIRVNAWEGVEWFHRESWDELLAWVDRLERVQTPPDERLRRPVGRSELVRTLGEAASAAGYRVDALRAALGAEAAGSDVGPAADSGASRGAGPERPPRLPKATGLPAGPPEREAEAAPEPETVPEPEVATDPEPEPEVER
jgi:hypothetical protein